MARNWKFSVKISVVNVQHIGQHNVLKWYTISFSRNKKSKKKMLFLSHMCGNEPCLNHIRTLARSVNYRPLFKNNFSINHQPLIDGRQRLLIIWNFQFWNFPKLHIYSWSWVSLMNWHQPTLHNLCRKISADFVEKTTSFILTTYWNSLVIHCVWDNWL
jgi:hypothetical protein